MNPDLTTRLKAVQDIKSRYYVGTQEAYELVLAAERTYQNPISISNWINKNVRILTEPTYLATPERVTGLDWLLESIVNSAMFKIHEKYPNASFNEQTELDFDALLLGDRFDYPHDIWQAQDIEPFVRLMEPYFFHVNQKKITTDQEFGNIVADIVSRKLNEWEQNKKRESNVGLQILSCYTNEILSYIQTVNWGDKLSRRIFVQEESKQLGSLHDGVDLYNLVNRIRQDMVDNRLEYRRMMVARLALYSRCANAQQLIEETRRCFKNSKERLDFFSRTDAPLPIITRERIMNQAIETLIPILVSEKKFIDRFLKS